MLRLLLLLAAGAAPADSSESQHAYERDIRPIFKAHCFQCHGEGGAREGGLDLRLRKLTVQGGDSGPAIVPGDTAASRLLDRVRSGEMPPIDKKLSAREIDTLQAWIAAGAPTARPEPDALGDGPLFTEEERRHWSFQPLWSGPSPAVSIGEAANPIDHFVLAKLQASGLDMSEEATPEELVRRVYFDLLGLPPTPEETAEFVNDRRPGAWERLIDRLLASPRYGERWGRHWLDVAGYADSEGYTDADPEREWAWLYRDWLIRSFNADKPFDLFIQQQLAGDELSGEELAARDGRDLSQEAIENLTAVGFLRMAPDGVGAGGVEREAAANQNIADTLQIIGSGLLGMTVHCAQCHDHRYDPIPQIDYYRLRAVFEPAMPWKGRKSPRERLVSLYTAADRAAAAAIEAEAEALEKERKRKAREFIARTLDEQLELAAPEIREKLRAAFQSEEKDRTPEQLALLKEHPNVANISTGSLYLYDGRRPEKVRQLEAQRAQKAEQYLSEARAMDPAVTLETLSTVLPAAAAELQADAEKIAAWKEFQPAAELKRMADEAEKIRAKKPPEQFLHTLVESAGEIPKTHLFHRGDHLEPRQEALPGDLSILGTDGIDIPADDPALPTSGRRLAFARHLTSGSHPLVARVLVNRVWLHHFGRGLVNTPADFGVLGERPTHPELLDALASEFSTRRDWSLKSLHRLILTSRAYRQTTKRSEALEAVDPENRLIGRMSAKRLEAEPLRDALLAIGGQLNGKMHGPPVPVMEDEVGQVVIGKENLDGEGKVDQAVPLHGEERRRSVYVQVRRSRPLAVLETFDLPAMSPHCEKRDFSTSASQSLLLMNNSLAIDAARRCAERVRAEAGDDETAQIERAYKIVYGRAAREQEIAAARQFLQVQRAAIAGQAEEAKSDPVELLALASMCHALVSSNEFLYVD
jgi:mono/diheme cytochrome c family protein